MICACYGGKHSACRRCGLNSPAVWFTPHMCRKTYWIRSLLQIVSCECTTARVGGDRPSTIDAWQCFLMDIRDCIKE